MLVPICLIYFVTYNPDFACVAIYSKIETNIIIKLCLYNFCED